MSEEMRPDGNVFWIKDKDIGIRPISLDSNDPIPSLCLTDPKFTVDDVLEKLSDAITPNQAKLCLGWVAANFFMEECYDLLHFFPFLFIAGMKNSGKSSVAFWLTGFFGYEQEGLMLSHTTPVALQRKLSYYSSMPVYVDEFRNSPEINRHIGPMRNVYNRQSAAKGIKYEFGTRSETIRGTLLIAGEETPRDPALLSRCIPIIVRVGDRRGKPNHFNWFMQNRLKFSYFTYQLLLKRKSLVPTFIDELTATKNILAETIDDRTAAHYAICVAGYHILFPHDDQNFHDWIIAASTDTVYNNELENAVNSFLDDMLVLKLQGKIDNKYWDVDNGKIYLYFHGLYQVWAAERIRGGDVPFKSGAIRDYLKEQPGFIDSMVNWRCGGGIFRCLVFDEQKSPEQLKNLVSETQRVTQ